MIKLLVFLGLSACPVPVAAKSPIRDRIYNPPETSLAAQSLPPGASAMRVVTDDGLTLTGVTIAPGNKPVLLVLHGSGASAADVATWLRPVADSGYGLVVAEYRGFSGNPGKPSEAGLLKDARAFLGAARTIYPGHEIVVVGHSLGGGVAFDLALAEPVGVIVTIGTFPSLSAAAPPIARPFLTDKFDNLGALAKLRPETIYFLLHGTDDEVIPSGLANQLHNAAVRLKRPGGSFVLQSQLHRPDPKLLASVLDYALAIIGGRAEPLPPGVQLAPFR